MRNRGRRSEVRGRKFPETMIRDEKVTRVIGLKCARMMAIKTGRRGAARPAVSHHPWLIGKNEQEEHGEVTRADQELAEEKKEKEPVKLSRSPDPVSNDTKHRDRLEDHRN